MTKAFLRQEYLRKRKNLTEQEAVEKSFLIRKSLESFLKKKSFKVIHTFLPQLNKNEIDTWEIISMLRISYPDAAIAAPYIIPGTKEMNHYKLDSDSVLIQNRWGIPEPNPVISEQIFPENIDVVLIPLLAFEKGGYRVGYGGGFYDRFLAQCSPGTFKIGLSFFEPVEIIGDLDKFDIQMNICISPTKIWYW